MAIEMPEKTSTCRFPASRKVYVEGSRPDLRVPFREISLSPTSGRLDVYDPATNTWTTLGAMPTARVAAAAGTSVAVCVPVR